MWDFVEEEGTDPEGLDFCDYEEVYCAEGAYVRDVFVVDVRGGPGGYGAVEVGRCVFGMVFER